MIHLPTKALSIRQPWAWAIFYADPIKDIENRTWYAVNRGRLDQPGRIAIHASKGMTQSEYNHAKSFMAAIGVVCPPASELQRGGIIGSVELVDCVRKHSSPWFFKWGNRPRGLVLANPEPCDLIPSTGALGLFTWQRDDSVTAPIARWMLPQTPEESELPILQSPLPQNGGENAS